MNRRLNKNELRAVYRAAQECLDDPCKMSCFALNGELQQAHPGWHRVTATYQEMFDCNEFDLLNSRSANERSSIRALMLCLFAAVCGPQ
jgi:hypothetical protein